MACMCCMGYYYPVQWQSCASPSVQLSTLPLHSVPSRIRDVTGAAERDAEIPVCIQLSKCKSYAACPIIPPAAQGQPSRLKAQGCMQASCQRLRNKWGYPTWVYVFKAATVWHSSQMSAKFLQLLIRNRMHLLIVDEDDVYNCHACVLNQRKH